MNTRSLSLICIFLSALPGLFPALGSQEEKPELSTNEKLTRNQALDTAPKPGRAFARFTYNLVREELDGITIPRAQFRGPIRFQTDPFQGWVTLQPDRDAEESLVMVREVNPKVRLSFYWIPKEAFLSDPPSNLWAYAKFLATNRRGDLRYNILSDYPRKPVRKPPNFLHRIPWTLQYGVFNEETEEVTFAYEFFLDFQDAWLNVKLESPEAFFQPNVQFVEQRFRFSQLLEN